MALAARAYTIGLWGALLLVLLRISIGWHFLYQGIWKLENPKFSSAGFLEQAKGPLADYYYNLLPDFWGQQRLQPDHSLGQLRTFRERFGKQYGLTADQVALADKALRSREEQVQAFFAEQEDALTTYRHDLQRWEEAKRQATADALPYQRKRLWDQQRKLMAQVSGWTEQLATWQDEFQTQLTNLLTAEQRRRGPLVVDKPTADLDRLIMFSNIAIGTCLIVGLLTRLAALGGGIFLLTIVLAQPEWPTVYPPAPPAAGRSLIVNKEFVEMMALFALAALPVGRWGGLDYWLHAAFERLIGRSPKR